MYLGFFIALIAIAVGFFVYVVLRNKKKSKSPSSQLSKLEQLAELKEKGAISEEEFSELKSKIMNKM